MLAQATAHEKLPERLLLSTPLHPLRWLLGRWQSSPAARTRLIPLIRTVRWEPLKAFIDQSIREVAPFYANVTVNLTRLEVSELQPLSRVAGRSRYRKANQITRSMSTRGLELFEPCLLRYHKELAYRLVLPPLVEKTADGYVVLDGVHRFKAAMDTHRLPSSVMVLVVEGALPPLPATPAEWRDVNVLKSQSRTKKFKNLRRGYFRPAGRFLRSDRFCFASLDQFKTACDAAVARRPDGKSTSPARG
jgi:hypothetical protein